MSAFAVSPEADPGRVRKIQGVETSRVRIVGLLSNVFELLDFKFCDGFKVDQGELTRSAVQDLGFYGLGEPIFKAIST